MDDILQLSFKKLENIDTSKSNLASFVLIRNTIISILSENKHNDTIMEDQTFEDEQIWLDNCISGLQQEDMEDEDEDDDVPLSPPQSNDDSSDFLQKDSYCEEQYYTIPYY